MAVESVGWSGDDVGDKMSCPRCSGKSISELNPNCGKCWIDICEENTLTEWVPRENGGWRATVGEGGKYRFELFFDDANNVWCSYSRTVEFSMLLPGKLTEAQAKSAATQVIDLMDWRYI